MFKCAKGRGALDLIWLSQNLNVEQWLAEFGHLLKKPSEKTVTVRSIKCHPNNTFIQVISNQFSPRSECFDQFNHAMKRQLVCRLSATFFSILGQKCFQFTHVVNTGLYAGLFAQFSTFGQTINVPLSLTDLLLAKTKTGTNFGLEQWFSILGVKLCIFCISSSSTHT